MPVDPELEREALPAPTTHIVDGEVKGVAVAESEFDPAGDDFPEKTLAPALIEMAKA